MMEIHGKRESEREREWKEKKERQMRGCMYVSENEIERKRERDLS